MSYDNSYYPNRKDWIKPYRKSKRFDRSCRNHGGCKYCEDSRLYQYRKELERTQYSIDEYKQGDDYDKM